ncbi:QcrA and Rieske domain-containing protein [Lignipirellula cremea]|uniref:Cytochrome b6-f complex iron-sulfur subunit n=1 Tax=Lignipirellula cremea TaxID=2528010 RepID=A0A518DYS7_9BACT|nr:Rieske (2Fe-2S) protein [Lignipirellula cremea]QDU97003.1 Cytochrome b6-f complex iron-sulfur subunit [Lignipirellula cremea]
MADPKKLSVEEILAACRKVDGDAASQAEPPASEATPPAESAATPPAAKTPSPAADKPAAKALPSGEARKLSVEEMLAAARAEKAKKAAAETAAPAAPAASAPADGGKIDSAAARKMSVAEMMAAARGEKDKKAAAPAAKKAPAAKPAAAVAKKEAAPVKGGPLDTASILAAARTDSKRGPMSKAEAAAKGVPVPAGKPAVVAPPMPQKPAYAQPRAPQPVADGSTRRGFMAAITGTLFGSSLAIGFTALSLTNVLWVLGLARFMFPNILTEPPTKFKVGFPGDLAPGQVETKYKAQFGVWIVRGDYEGRDMIYALKSVCTHLGCTPNWLEGEQKFKCPCHGSGFYKDGINFEGPAPRPLERYAIRVSDDGQLEVDKSQTFNEEKGDWKDPASFVA